MLTNSEMYMDMTVNTDNFNTYSQKVKKYIKDVEDNYNLPECVKGLLHTMYDISYTEFCMRFFDFDDEQFKMDDFKLFIMGFCSRIETIQMIGVQKENKESVF